MIHRLVKLTFHPEHTKSFEANYREYRGYIRAFPGCRHLELWRDAKDPNVYFTFSKWERAEDLENYRQSEFFRDIWAKTKKLFSDRPQAWSVDKIAGDND